jgi:drug/metabolite transporter (DMT)-like permease
MLYRPAFLLGYAGLLPAFAALVIALFGPPDWRELAFRAGALYAGLILSFLGGSWWGLATRSGPARAWALYLLAVGPTLAAMALLLVLTPPRLVLLAGLLMLTLPIDRLLVKIRLAPENWMQLRLPLTIGLALATAGLGVAAMI